MDAVPNCNALQGSIMNLTLIFQQKNAKQTERKMEVRRTMKLNITEVYSRTIQTMENDANYIEPDSRMELTMTTITPNCDCKSVSCIYSYQ